MHFVGHISGFRDEERVALLERFEALRADVSFGEDARQPGMESRWSQGREGGFVPVRPEVVVEASYDQTTGGRLRHAARFERWRPDKEPGECTLDGLGRPEGAGFQDVLAEARRDA